MSQESNSVFCNVNVIMRRVRSNENDIMIDKVLVEISCIIKHVKHCSRSSNKLQT